MMPAELTDLECALLLMTSLEARGGTFTINADGFLHADLDAITPERMPGDPDLVIRMVLALAGEIKTILRSRHVTH